jgi:hypothetical protein
LAAAGAGRAVVNAHFKLLPRRLVEDEFYPQKLAPRRRSATQALTKAPHGRHRRAEAQDRRRERVPSCHIECAARKRNLRSAIRYGTTHPGLQSAA